MESQDREFEQKVEKNLNYLLEMCVNELNHEREKKQSLENRASWGITLLGVIITVLFENPDLSRLFTYPILFKNYFLLSIIILLAIATLFFLTLVIITEKKFHSIFFDDSLEKNFLTDDEIKPISSVIDYYEKTCKVYKKNNQKKAFYLNISLLLNLILFIFLSMR